MLWYRTAFLQTVMAMAPLDPPLSLARRRFQCTLTTGKRVEMYDVIIT